MSTIPVESPAYTAELRKAHQDQIGVNDVLFTEVRQLKERVAKLRQRRRKK